MKILIQKLIQKLTKQKEEPSLLARSIFSFTKEGWVSQLQRQDRLQDYTYTGKNSI